LARRAEEGFTNIDRYIRNDELPDYVSRVPSDSPKRDFPFYVAAVLLGIFAGWVDLKLGELLFTALLVVASCMLLGALRPQRPWRWVLAVGICIPLVELAGYLVMTQKPYRAQIYESFLAFLPGIAGAYGGAMLRAVVSNLLQGK
jgi:hypothetical protein